MNGWVLTDRASKRFALASRANVGEVFPDPISPLNATAGFLHNLEPGWRDAFVRCGVWDHDLYDDEVPHNPLLCFGGYLYLNMSLMRLFGVRVPGFTPEAVDAQYFGDMPGIPSYASEARPGDENAGYSAKAGAWLMNEVLGASGLDELDRDRAEVRSVVAARTDLREAGSSELIARVTGFDALFRRLWCRHIEVSLKTGVGLGAVAQVAAAIGQPQLALELVSGIGDVDSAGASRDMWPLGRQVAASRHLQSLFDAGVDGLQQRLASDRHPDAVSFRKAFAAFLDAWGFRGPNEWELRCDTWGTRPEIALSAIDRLRHATEAGAPGAGHTERIAQREKATQAVRAALDGNAEALAGFEAGLRAAHLFSRGRERTRMTAGMLVHEQRLAARELGRRAAGSGAIARQELVFMLLRSELEDFAAHPSKYAVLLQDRERKYLELFELIPPFVVVGDPPPLAQWERRSGEALAAIAVGETVAAVAGSPGKVSGRACVILDPAHADKLEPGDIMIAPITDPSWTPLFLAVGAVVCNVGAPFSHAAIVSREINIPCVLSVQDATRRIPDGAMIEVDGNAGSITRLS
jgi:pyruvate,water dikinase